ncbi:OmpA family protein [Thalassotalea piscium]
MNNFNAKQNSNLNKSIIATAVSLVLAYNTSAYAKQDNIDPKCLDENTCSARDIVGKISDDGSYFKSKVLQNTEKLLANDNWTFHGLTPVAVDKVTVPEITNKSLTIDDIPNLTFASGKHAITEKTKKRLDKVVAQLAGKKNVRLHFVGHTDNQKLSSRAKSIYQSNVGLSNFRASIIAKYFQQQLSLNSRAITTEGKGSSLPIADNSTLKGMEKNRRVELYAWFDEEVEAAKLTEHSDFLRQEVCQLTKVAAKPFVVTIDGTPMIAEQSANDADHQRCTDIALDNANVQLQYDNLKIQAALNVTSVVRHHDDNIIVDFQGYSNYSTFIDKAEIRIFTDNASVQSEPAFIISLDKNNRAKWQSEQVLSTLSLDEPLSYRLRVYNESGQFDETQTFALNLSQQTNVELPIEQALLAGYGESHLSIQNIPLTGGTLTVNGDNVPSDHSVYFLGKKLPVNAQQQFVAEQIIPSGIHNVEVAILDEQGNGELFQRHLELKSNDWFYVGMADLTLGKNSSTGSIGLLTGDNQHFDNDLFIDGRIALYAKGKWKDDYTITTSLDSQEEPLNELFSNLNKKDPSSLLRRLEEENHYAVYGDDSTVIEDAPTQGRFYAKINDDKSHLMWGNFIADIKDTEFSRIERGLYGASLDWNTEALTQFGERVGNVKVFAAEAGTSAAYEELRGTGGSLYYLQNQDITQGSERVTIEVRDKDSNLVISSTPLVAGQDYDVDALQGRILLTKPLASISNDNLIVRTGGLSGHPTYLVVNYEYTPGFEELDNLSVGGRASYWLNDNLKVGITASKEDMGIEDHKLTGLDLTYRHSAQSYVKLETAQTRGQGVSGVNSSNGGFNFSDISSSSSSNIAADDKAKAYRIESAFIFNELGFGSKADSGLQSRGNFYWQQRQQGFSGVGQFSQYDTDQAGVQFQLPVTENTQTSLRLDTRDEDGGIDKFSAEMNIAHQLNEQWQLSAGLRIEDTETSDQQSQNIGERTDLAVQLDYQNSSTWGLYGFAQGTLKHDESKFANNRVGLGGKYQVNDAVSLLGEASEGNQGFGAKIGSDYQYSDASNVYLNYELDPDRTDNGLAGRNGQLVSGVRHRFTDAVNVYGEERYQHGNNGVGLTHAYGIEFLPSEKWVLGLSYENGKLEDADQATIKRNAIALNAGYATKNFKYGTSLEFRQDEQGEQQRDSYLIRNNLSYKVNPDWRAQLRIDFAISDSSVADQLNSDYTEGLLGLAYRPVDNDRFNALVTYNYLYDLAPADQYTDTGQQNDYQQRSHVFAFDANYDLTTRWTLGAKYAYKRGEVRQGREEGVWYDSTTNLYVVRANWHVVRHWDFLVEGRMLDVKAAQDNRKGFLTAIHRHFGNNLKVGIGYNFTDFSDDLTDLNYDAKGWFLNIVVKI